jgi:aconitate hydratase
MRKTAVPWAGQLAHAGRVLSFVDLPRAFGARVAQLPWVLRVMLENVVRNMEGDERRAAVDRLLGWLQEGSSTAEIAFQPSRVLMHDTTSTPALVDIAAMRDALAEAGADPTLLNPGLPVDVSVDHSLAVEAYAHADASLVNLRHEMRRNDERYRFLRWASKALRNVRIHPPGTGIMHTINLEQLATVVTTKERDGTMWAVPDTMIGTDSHTPMVNGIGVLGWGVGGLEAQTVMFGMPTMIRIPDVTGVRLTGRLREGVQATDLALVVTHRLRKLDVTGDFVEFFGPGVATLRGEDRAVVANMAPEYGAMTGYFPIDERTLDFLRERGRTGEHVELVEHYARRAGLWFDEAASPRYTRVVEIDLGEVAMHVAGPRRPQDLLPYGGTRAALEVEAFEPKRRGDMPRHPVAIAAITSCTNTSDPKLLVAAGLLARNARRLGLKPPAWVKTSLAPGSPAAASFLERAGLLEDLSAVGFDIVGYGCTTCIGNPGPLPDAIRTAQEAGEAKGVAILSGNRNFPGRVHPDIELSFIMSPALVIAFAMVGDAEIDLSRDPVGLGADGQPVFLKDIWPTDEDIRERTQAALDAGDFGRDFARASSNPLWHALESPEGPLYPWNPASTALRRPPFASLDAGSMLGEYTAYPLLVLGDDVTTDHISPASAIPPDSLVADYLVERGDKRDDLNVFASRRGNWEVMMRAAFHSKTLRNLLCPQAPVAHTLHCPSGDVMPIWDVAQRYRHDGESVVIVAGERYGMGSSRDWAAKGQRLLGVRAVLACGFERIHRSNLIGMGILPIELPQGVHPDTLRIACGDRITVKASADSLDVRASVPVTMVRRDGRKERFEGRAAVETRLELELLRHGGVMPMILKRALAEVRTAEQNAVAAPMRT